MLIFGRPQTTGIVKILLPWNKLLAPLRMHVIYFSLLLCESHSWCSEILFLFLGDVIVHLSQRPAFQPNTVDKFSFSFKILLIKPHVIHTHLSSMFLSMLFHYPWLFKIHVFSCILLALTTFLKVGHRDNLFLHPPWRMAHCWDIKY